MKPGEVSPHSPGDFMTDEPQQKERDMITNRTIEIPEGYEALAYVLDKALNQAAHGKGKERHATGEPFDQQPICAITRRVGFGYPLGQAEKKIEESQRLDTDAAVFELLGAINYLAAAVICLEEYKNGGIKK